MRLLSELVDLAIGVSIGLFIVGIPVIIVSAFLFKLWKAIVGG